MNIAVRILAVSIGFTAALAIAELGLRLFRIAPAGGVFTVTDAQFHAVPGIFAPGRQVVVRRIPQLPHEVTIDRLGYRGRDVPPIEKTHEEFRVFFAGDSFAFGDFVDDDETMPARLQDFLSRDCAGVRVINGGIGGSTIVDQKEMVLRALPLEPDLVVLQFSENDVQDLEGSPLWDQLARNRAAKSKFPFAVVYPILRETAMWNVALRAAATARAPAMTPDAFVDPRSNDASVDSLRALYRDHLGALRDTLRSRMIPLVFVLYPSHLTLYGHWSTDQLDWAESMARRAGIPTISLLEPLARSGLPDNQLYLLPHDGHPGPKGYERAAEYLAERLLEIQPARQLCRSDADRI